jgi:cell division protein ZapA (FtsZ GTPase activity inhibitor)
MYAIMNAGYRKPAGTPRRKDEDDSAEGMAMVENEVEHMKNRTELIIAGETYGVISDESSEYMQKIAALVNEKIAQAREKQKTSTLRATVMAACTLADDYLKAQETMNHMRAEWNTYVQETERLKRELAKAQQTNHANRPKKGKR